MDLTFVVRIAQILNVSFISLLLVDNYVIVKPLSNLLFDRNFQPQETGWLATMQCILHLEHVHMR